MNLQPGTENAVPDAERRLLENLRAKAKQVEAAALPKVQGLLTRVVGFTLEAQGCKLPVGAQCAVAGPGTEKITAEVVGFAGEKLFLMPTEHLHGLQPGAKVVPISKESIMAVGDELLGRIIDADGNPLDDKPAPNCSAQMPPAGRSINPLRRLSITTPLDVGVKAINTLLTVGKGQRLGLFAPAGVGKSVLLGMMTRFTDADVIVIGLIGERGREVKEFIEGIAHHQGMDKTVVVAAPADRSPVLRIRAAMRATCIAEYFRDQGKQVLFLMDSLTRFAQAQREISLAIGEPPASKGYTPSVFSKLGQLVERAGNAEGQGSITAFYTVLTEGLDQTDPVAETAQAILDGHIVLSREYADAGHYPAIDIEASISRVMSSICAKEHMARVYWFKRLFSRYRQNADLIRVGAYAPGQDPDLDEAVALYPALGLFLQQGMDEQVNWEQSSALLDGLVQAAAQRLAS